ncbi:translocation/assembly module TamB domain-containing protein [candidate division WOR-3 bacterium]|nr:translocation/assembly module TamB domain-containing protein [candidate division WOR-3 bacterium]
MDFRGPLEAPTAEATLKLSDVALYDELINDIEFVMSLASGMFFLHQGKIESRRGRIDISGRYDPGSDEFTAALAAEKIVFRSPEVFGMDTVRASAAVGMDMVFSGNLRNPQGAGTVVIESLVYDTFELGDYHFDISLADTTLAVSLANSQQSMLIDAEINLHGDMPFTAKLKAEHFMLEDHLTIARGYITADLVVQGDFVQPENLSALLRIDTARITIEQRLLENIGPVKARLEQGVVTIETCELAIAGQPLRVEGRIPLDHQRGAIDLYAATPSIELSDIASFLPAHPALSGTMQLELRVQGMAGAPEIDGRLTLVDGRYEDSHVLADSVICRLGMSSNVIRIDELAGRINRGRFRVNGSAGLAPGRLDTVFLDIVVNKATYANKEFGRATVSADVQVTGRQDSLRVAGEIVVDEGVYDAPIRLQSIIGLLTAANRPEPQQPEIMRRIYCDIGISVPDRFEIANNVADLAARADLQVKGYLARLNVYGTVMAVGPGTVQYLGRKFQIVNGVIQFDDPYRIDPVIDLAAVTSVATAEGSIDIYLLLTGTTTTWQLVLSSNPPLPEQDIVSLLLIGRRRPGEAGTMVGDINLKGRARDYALDAIRQGIEKSTQDLLGLDKFTLTGNLGEPMTMRIGVEKSIVKGFTLLYNTGVESWELYQIGASYDLTDHISIFTLHDQENLNTSIDLNFRFKLR